MTKFKKVITMLLVLAMVMTSGMFAFADGDTPLQENAVTVNEAENTDQTEVQPVEETATPSIEQEGGDENQGEQTPGEEVEGETDSDGTITESPDTTGDEVINEILPQTLSETGVSAIAEVGTEQEPEFVTASVFHRLENKVPTNILHDFSQAEFGPYGESVSPYFYVTVNMKAIKELVKAGILCEYKEDGYIYYSAQANPNTPLSSDQSTAKAAARTCWDAIFDNAISEGDQEKFINAFGVKDANRTPNFIGYVFKKEVDGWHIDGILDRAPAYMTEFFLNEKLMKTDVSDVAMTTETAKEKIAEILGIDPAAITGMSGEYEKDYKIYQYTIEKGAYSPENQHVKYDEKIHQSFYQAKIKIETKQIGHKPVPVNPKTAIYKVEHYLQQLDGSYKLAENATEFPLYAEIGATVTAEPKNFVGHAFNADKSEQTRTGIVIAPKAGADGEPEYLVLKMYYDVPVPATPITPKAAVYETKYYLQKPDGTYELADGQFPIYAEIGATVTAEPKEFEGYTFNADKSNPTGTVIEPITVDGNPVYLVLNMYYDRKPSEPSDVPATPVTPKAAVYKVEYYLQQPDGEYVLKEDATEFPLYAEIGATVTAEPKEFEGYTFNADKSNPTGTVIEPITVDGNPVYLVLEMYYDRKPAEPSDVPAIPITPKAAVYETRYYLQKPDGTYELSEDKYELLESQFPLYGEIGATVTAEPKEFEGYTFNADKSNPTGTVIEPITVDDKPVYLVLNMYYDRKPSEPSDVPATPVTPKAAVYKVEHYLQQIDGSYKLAEDATEFPLYAEIGATVTAEQKEFEGYTYSADKSYPTGTVIEPITVDGNPVYLVLKMYYDIKPSEPPYVPIGPDPVIPDPVNPQPLPPDDPLIEPVEPQPLPPDDPLIEPVEPQPLPDDEYLADSTYVERPEDPDHPKTGDEAPVMVWFGMLFVSAVGLITICIKRKKED